MIASCIAHRGGSVYTRAPHHDLAAFNASPRRNEPSIGARYLKASWRPAFGDQAPAGVIEPEPDPAAYFRHPRWWKPVDPGTAPGLPRSDPPSPRFELAFRAEEPCDRKGYPAVSRR